MLENILETKFVQRSQSQRSTKAKKLLSIFYFTCNNCLGTWTKVVIFSHLTTV